MEKNQIILVTGAAGFIGFHLCKRLLDNGHCVVGIDNINDYYSVSLKNSRLEILISYKNFIFRNIDISDQGGIESVFSEYRFRNVIHLAAQAGVRYSQQNPQAYVNSNLVGFFNIIEVSRIQNVEHFVFASTSSVYGLNTHIPFSASDNTDHPISLYAATKKSNEAIAHSYSYMYNLPVTALRFFTVYGPWGRPDMAYFLFADAISKNEPIILYEAGRLMRDFTYVDDIIESIIRIVNIPPKFNKTYDCKKPDPSKSLAPYRVLNIGNNDPVSVIELVGLIEKELRKKAIIINKSMDKSDVAATYADIKPLIELTGFKPNTPLDFGIKQFIKWYHSFFKL